jgi:23S rRNA (cytidine1920-2'-O)/16S rRNA (cytidine1409-2'-O)-methyltransferase
MAARRRLDAELLRRELAPSRTAAQALIDADRVIVNGAVAAKASRQVSPGDAIVVEGPPSRFVGRGAEKLEHALTEFDVDVSGLRVLDAGASTGGFTDCLLQRGAAEVVAVDVGHGQLHERLRTDPRVVNIERQNIRSVTTETLGGPVDGAVGDLSFISLRLVIAPIAAVCKPGAFMILLVKPQFEAGRSEVSRGRGVVTDPLVHERVRAEISTAIGDAGCRVQRWTTSPITGAEGNVEFLVHATIPLDDRPVEDSLVDTSRIDDSDDSRVDADALDDSPVDHGADR